MEKQMITEHFSLEEMTRSAALDRLNKGRKNPIVNNPDELAMSRLRVLCDSLEQIRAKLGEPLYISSGYRNELVNSYVGGSRHSLHLMGAAADIRLPLNKAIIAAQFAMNLPHAKEVLISDNISGATWLHFGIFATNKTDICRVGVDHNGRVNYCLHFKSLSLQK